MKGIVHFTVGVAAASCIPGTVEAGAHGNPLFFLLGGIAGLLPDTLDFKVGRFFYRHDVHLVPDPLKPDAQLIADAVAGAVNRALRENRPIRIRLSTIRLGADEWQSYTVTFDVGSRRVIAEYGPRVDTGGNPLVGEPSTGGEGRKVKRKGVAALEGEIRLEYEAETRVDIFDGPIFEMVPVGPRMVSPIFIPWHRQWSHAFPLALALAVLSAGLWGWVAGVVVFAAYAAHIGLDQVGYMGSNLFHPFTRRRTAGLRWMHSGEALGNLSAVWGAALVVFWNLYRSGPIRMVEWNPLKLVFFGALLPLLAALAFRKWTGRAS